MNTGAPGIVINLRRQAHYWQAQHSRAVERENALKERIVELEEMIRQLSGRIAEEEEEKEQLNAQDVEQKQQIEALKAKIVLLQQQLYGQKSEQRKGSGGTLQGHEQATTDQAVVRKRGKQLGAKGYGRKRHRELATEEIIHELPEEKQTCPVCGKRFAIFPGTDDSEEIDWEVRLVRRVHKRRRYIPTCNCGAVAGIVTARPVEKLIPKGMFSTAFWARLVMEKYLLQRPLYRIRQELALDGLVVSQGTLTGGLERIGELVQPLYTKILEQNRTAEHWHMDETRWMVFEEVEGKANCRWWLWVMVTSDTCAYLLDPSRSAAVIEKHLGNNIDGIISADRYSAYKALPGNVEIAFCWSHVRRDYLRIQEAYPALYAWGESWVKRINDLFRCNSERLAVISDPEQFFEKDRQLRNALCEMVNVRDGELADPALHPVQRKVLESLNRHWSGLIIFVDHPHVPMDNNEAERCLRNPVIGRKNYYGSGSIWSGTLTAALFTICQTSLINHIDPQQYLLHYFNACAHNGGKAPAPIDPFLPWNLSVEQKDAWHYPRSP